MPPAHFVDEFKLWKFDLKCQKISDVIDKSAVCCCHTSSSVSQSRLDVFLCESEARWYLIYSDLRERNPWLQHCCRSVLAVPQRADGKWKEMRSQQLFTFTFFWHKEKHSLTRSPLAARVLSVWPGFSRVSLSCSDRFSNLCSVPKMTSTLWRRRSKEPELPKSQRERRRRKQGRKMTLSETFFLIVFILIKLTAFEIS